MKCDGLPNPASVSEMNTYIYLWRAVEERGLLEDVVRRTAEVLEVSSKFFRSFLNRLITLVKVITTSHPRRLEFLSTPL